MGQNLRLPLRFNAAFSLLSGLVLSIAPATVGQWLGVDAKGWLRLAGLVLIGHGLLLAWAAGQPNPTPMARLNLVAIAPYPLLMLALVASGVIDRMLGQALALVDGTIIDLVALWHWPGLRRARILGQSQPA